MTVSVHHGRAVGASIRRGIVVMLSMMVMSIVWTAVAIAAPSATDERMAALRIARPTPAPAAPFDLVALDGGRVDLRTLAGKVVLINFWATWCGPCKEEMPTFERLRQHVDSSRVVVLTITTDMQRDGIRHFLAGLHVKLPVLFDENQDISQAYFVRALPTSVIIDPKGMVVGRAVGTRAWDSPAAVSLLHDLAEARP
ncbi:MAG: TlpA disulfide reductase family protein [Nitrospiraceae bacterium]